MNRIISAIIVGIFAVVTAWFNSKSNESSIKGSSGLSTESSNETTVNIDNSQNKTIEDSHDIIIINTTRMTKINNAENVIIK